MGDPGLEALLEFLKTARGFDFTGYKRASLERRFRRRMEAVGCAGFAEYHDFLEVHPEELEQLFDMLLIYGTDVDEDALSQARAAVYTAKELESVPEEKRTKYFERADRRFAFRGDLRRTVIFGRNNLLQDAPISRLDLLLCRNTLMYFTAESQARILRQFHFALGDAGTLMLGKSEMMLSHRDAFKAVDLKQRIFRRDGSATTLQSRIAGLAASEKLRTRDDDEDDRRSRDAALELAPHAQVIVSRSGLLTFANLTARTLFSLSHEDLGARFS